MDNRPPNLSCMQGSSDGASEVDVDLLEEGEWESQAEENDGHLEVDEDGQLSLGPQGFQNPQTPGAR